jgi:hypothetical protein
MSLTHTSQLAVTSGAAYMYEVRDGLSVDVVRPASKVEDELKSVK